MKYDISELERILNLAEAALDTGTEFLFISPNRLHNLITRLIDLEEMADKFIQEIPEKTFDA